MLRLIRSSGWCLSMPLMREVTVLALDAQQCCGNLTSLLTYSILSKGNSELRLEHTRETFLFLGNRKSKKCKVQSSLLGWLTVWKQSWCQTLWRLYLLHYAWGVYLMSDTAACCVYLPMYNTLVWLSEWFVPRLTWVASCRADGGWERMCSLWGINGGWRKFKHLASSTT